MVFRQRGFEPANGDGGGQDAPPTARWLAWAAACLLVAALVSAGVIGFGDGSPDAAIVSAAGSTPSTVAVPSTVTVPPPASSTAPPAPTSTIRTTTTLPRAAAAVLKAIGTTAPPTTQAPPAATTTRPPVTTTTPTTVRPPTTTTTSTSIVPGRATITLTNVHGHAFIVIVNGQEFDLDPGEIEGPVELTLPAAANDVIELRPRTNTNPSCTARGEADYLQPGGRYKVTVAAGTTDCEPLFSTPVIEVIPLQ